MALVAKATVFHVGHSAFYTGLDGVRVGFLSWLFLLHALVGSNLQILNALWVTAGLVAFAHAGFRGVDLSICHRYQWFLIVPTHDLGEEYSVTAGERLDLASILVDEAIGGIDVLNQLSTLLELDHMQRLVRHGLRQR